MGSLFGKSHYLFLGHRGCIQQKSFVLVGHVFGSWQLQKIYYIMKERGGLA